MQLLQVKQNQILGVIISAIILLIACVHSQQITKESAGHKLINPTDDDEAVSLPRAEEVTVKKALDDTKYSLQPPADNDEVLTKQQDVKDKATKVEDHKLIAEAVAKNKPNEQKNDVAGQPQQQQQPIEAKNKTGIIKTKLATENKNPAVPPVKVVTTLAPLLAASEFYQHEDISDSLKAGFYFFVALSLSAITFIVFKVYRLRLSRAERKYGVQGDRSTQELTPLPIAIDDGPSDDEDQTVFEVHRQNIRIL